MRWIFLFALVAASLAVQGCPKDEGSSGVSSSGSSSSQATAEDYEGTWFKGDGSAGYNTPETGKTALEIRGAGKFSEVEEFKQGGQMVKKAIFGTWDVQDGMLVLTYQTGTVITYGYLKKGRKEYLTLSGQIAFHKWSGAF